MVKRGNDGAARRVGERQSPIVKPERTTHDGFRGTCKSMGEGERGPTRRFLEEILKGVEEGYAWTVVALEG